MRCQEPMQKGLSESLVSRWILVPAPDVLVNTLIKVSPEGSTLDLPDAAPGAHARGIDESS